MATQVIHDDFRWLVEVKSQKQNPVAPPLHNNNQIIKHQVPSIGPECPILVKSL